MARGKNELALREYERIFQSELLEGAWFLRALSDGFWLFGFRCRVVFAVCIGSIN